MRIAFFCALFLGSLPALAADPKAIVGEAWSDVAKTYVDMPVHRAEWKKAKTTYVKMYKSAEQAHAAIRAMLAVLKNSRLQWLSGEDVKSIVPQFSGPLPNLGMAYLSFEFLPDRKKVITPLADSPAAQAGIRTGDILQSVNGRNVSGMSPGELVRLLDRVADRQAKLVLMRDAVTVTAMVEPSDRKLEPISLKTVPSETGVVAEITVREFTMPALKQFEEAVNAAVAKGAHEYTIDVRNNPGGLVDAMMKMAGLFVPGQEFLCVRTASGESTCRKTATGKAVEGKVRVLVNEGTASAAEVLAAGFQRTKRGQVIGCRTYGHGYGGQLVMLSDGSALLIPDSSYVDSQGQLIEGRGITPDVEQCPTSPSP